ncbi:MAG: ABC transporter permease [Verrucomicrobia bacterium]|nr:ABC transporter permease [Verrucomicrobiota bacterium]
MALPLRYNVRNVFVRWRATLATVLGIALVVAVFVLVQALAAGLEKSSRNTGDPRNVMVVRKGSTAESSSQVTREQLRLMLYWPEIAKNSEGTPLVSADVLVLISLPRLGNTNESHVLVRGISPVGASMRAEVEARRDRKSGEPILRPQVTLVEGRWFVPGKREVVASRKLARRFSGMNIGGSFKTAGQHLTVVGWLDGSDSAFDSEVWMDGDEARSVFDRENYSSVLIRVPELAAVHSLTNRIETEKRLPLRAVQESAYYASQTMTAMPIKILGAFLATAMSIGAVFAAMNTMYASVGARTREIGTLRVLGYRRRTILLGFILEGAFLASLGGALGCVMAFPMHGVSTGTMSFESFSEVVFHFRITPALVTQGMVFSVLVGIVGSLLPAIRASRLPVIAALKAV